MEDKLTIAGLISNNTLSAEMAALLWQAVSEKKSFLVSAMYRNTGKSTLSRAILDLRQKDVSLHYISDNKEVTDKLLPLEKKGGYLVIAEISPAQVPGYIWGEKIQHVFDLAKTGYSIEACLHAENAQEAIMELTRKNGIKDEDASLINLILHIEMFGSTPAAIKRRLTQIYEVHFVENGKPMGHTLYEWNKETDSFEKTAESHFFAKDKESLARRKRVLEEIVSLGKISEEQVKEAVDAFT